MPNDLQFTLNGEPVTLTVEGERPLLGVLREDLGLTGTKYGCGEGQCRACTVLVNGEPKVSCLLSAAEVAGQEVLTIEGLAPEGGLHPVQQAYIDESAMQCGYCVPGMVLRTVALLEEHPAPSEAQIVEAMNGNLCRCCNYANILRAIQRAAGAAEARA